MKMSRIWTLGNFATGKFREGDRREAKDPYFMQIIFACGKISRISRRIFAKISCARIGGCFITYSNLVHFVKPLIGYKMRSVQKWCLIIAIDILSSNKWIVPLGNACGRVYNKCAWRDAISKGCWGGKMANACHVHMVLYVHQSLTMLQKMRHFLTSGDNW